MQTSPGLTEGRGVRKERVQHLSLEHGGAEGPGIQSARSHPWRQRDFTVMTSPEFKKVLAENHIILVSWRDLKKIM
jgi:hypothetical protein